MIGRLFGNHTTMNRIGKNRRQFLGGGPHIPFGSKMFAGPKVFPAEPPNGRNDKTKRRA